ncbi:MAG: hypothetical protein JSW67_06780 [Candidatus Latescibacterota bacterium]|nr:MAG: hypothetical protein JSW67_06780 [Candidatus Latescibacterota bacterium]
MRHRSIPLALLAAAWFALALAGCEPSATPASLDDTTSYAKVKGLKVPGLQPADEHETPTEPCAKRPLKGRFRTFEPNWVVSHFREGCDGSLDAGAEVASSGNVTHMGKTYAVASAAWNWADEAARVHTPVGPTTGSSASLITSYPHAFCGRSEVATGDVVLTAANGDEVHGTITGGEVYELGFERAGDGQEQFIEVTIMGGTGRFDDAIGCFVLHIVFDLFEQKMLLGEILEEGSIDY